jgi:hypothetical protein
MMLNEPRNFGSFDPVIFGLRFNIDGAITASNAKELLPLVWRGIHFASTKEHQDFIHSLNNDGERFEAVSYFSLRVHESRHFHDLLGTPYGSMLLRQYFRAAILGQALMTDLVLRTKSLYVPIVDWAANDRFLQSRFRDLGTLPRSIAWFAEILSTMSTKLDTFNRGVLASTALASADGLPRIDACGILEGSAITSQELHIEENYGLDTARLFRRMVWESPVGRQYYGARQLVEVLSGEPIPAQNFLALCLCALCGNFQDPDSNHTRYPADLLLEMLMWMAKTGFQPSRASSAEDVVEVADRFFRTEHGSSLMGNLRQASEANLKTFEALEHDVEKMDKSAAGEPARSLLAGLKNYATAYEGYVRNVFTHVNDYCDVTYSRELDKHTRPVFFLESEYGIPLTEELEKAYFIGAEAELHGGAELESRLHSQIAPRGDNRFKSAFLISPKHAVSGAVDPTAIDVKLWQKNFEHSEMVRFLVAGGTNNMPQSQQWISLATLLTGGTKVFTVSGEMRTSARIDFDRVIGQGANEMMAAIRELKANTN